MLVGQGVKVSDAGVASGDKGVLVALVGFDGVRVPITEVASFAGKVLIALVAVTVWVDEGVGVRSRIENNQ